MGLDGYDDIFSTSSDIVGTVIVCGPYTSELLTQQVGNTQFKAKVSNARVLFWSVRL